MGERCVRPDGPVRESHLPPTGSEPKRAEGMDEKAGTRQPLIMLISRDVTSAMYRCAELTLAGWKAIHADDIMEALSFVKSRGVDLVLLHLPPEELAGIDLPAIMREIEPLAYLPVMVIADRPAEQDRCQFLNHGADDVISADISADEMIARVRSALRVKDLHDQLAASRSALQQALARERKLMAKLRRDNAELQELCVTDPLTRVQNVRSFRDILEHEFKMAKRYSQHLSLLMLDVDHFKLVNDNHGHPSGDYVLKELAVILKRSVRESDVVSRTGGEEFSVILPKTDRSQAATFAERIRGEVSAREFSVYGRGIHVTTSVGCACYPADAEITEAGMLVYFADQALLAAKEMGRDKVVEFHELGMENRRRLRRKYLTMRPGEEQRDSCEEPLATDERSERSLT